MSPSETFTFSDVPESNHQPQIEVVSCVDMLCAYTLGLSFAIAPSPSYEVPSFLWKNIMH
jgi:hypothetical protein